MFRRKFLQCNESFRRDGKLMLFLDKLIQVMSFLLIIIKILLSRVFRLQRRTESFFCHFGLVKKVMKSSLYHSFWQTTINMKAASSKILRIQQSFENNCGSTFSKQLIWRTKFSQISFYLRCANKSHWGWRSISLETPKDAKAVQELIPSEFSIDGKNCNELSKSRVVNHNPLMEMISSLLWQKLNNLSRQWTQKVKTLSFHQV